MVASAMVMPEILHSDDRIVVMDKPAGLLSVPGIGPANRQCLSRWVQARHAGARIVHRLDRETSGVIVMALDAESHRDLSRQFEQRLVEKRYIAVAAGAPGDDAGEIDLPLRKDLDPPTPAPTYIVDHVQGRTALTRYRVLRRDVDRTRLELRPHTGRSHQLRVHLAAIGHPILGDDIYAPPHVIAMADRLMLHAEALSIEHPGTRQRMTFESRCVF